MVTAPVKPDRVQDLRDLLATMNSSPGVVDPDNALVPFGRFETIHDVITPEDDARAEALGWTRAAPSAPVEPWYKPGELVQIRRPGKRPKAENVPMSVFDGAE